MMVFHFNLESLLDHRRFIEESKQRNLASIQHEFNQAEKRLIELKQNQTQLMQDFKHRLNSSMQSYEFMMLRTYVSRLTNEIESQQEIIRQITTQLNTARIELLSARKDRKSLEKYKEKKKQDFIRKMAKKEQKLLNEAALLRVERGRQR